MFVCVHMHIGTYLKPHILFQLSQEKPSQEEKLIPSERPREILKFDYWKPNTEMDHASVLVWERTFSFYLQQASSMQLNRNQNL